MTYDDAIVFILESVDRLIEDAAARRRRSI